MKRLILHILTILVAANIAFAGNPKREFRGAWLHTVFQDQYLKQTTAQNKKYLINQLDSLRDAGVNAILFQVRPQSDAFYDSKLEPWSRFLTNDGKAPNPYWDPLQFMIDECHARGMELHAWLNPYRVTSSKNQTLPSGHIYYKHKDRFVTFDGKMYFDPGIPENRQFIEQVVLDIVNRYDVDGIHFDDYFYPYPVKGVAFPDSNSFAKYGNGMKLNDWRRHNVDMLIEELHQQISEAKPWVRFGISPFGIWRNKTSDSRGSDTKGLQNYDDLYADVLLWAEKGWVDYLLPQLYWDLEHKSASYLVLVDWWNKNANNRHMYIGQDVTRTMKYADIAPSTETNQLRHKVELTRSAENIQGNCWWPGYAVTRNVGGAADILRTDLQSNIALCPTYPWISEETPAAVTDLKCTNRKLTWATAATSNKTSDIVRYVIYYFKNDNAIDIENSNAIISVTNKPEFTATKAGVYVVTCLDRVNNESKPSKITVK